MIDLLRWLLRREEEQDTDRLHEWTDRTPLDSECPDTQPTSPGALDSLENVMKTAILAVVILTLTGCATIKGVAMTDEEREVCAVEGCTVWTEAELRALVTEAMRRGYLAAQKQRSSI